MSWRPVISHLISTATVLNLDAINYPHIRGFYYNFAPLLTDAIWDNVRFISLTHLGLRLTVEDYLSLFLRSPSLYR